MEEHADLKELPLGPTAEQRQSFEKRLNERQEWVTAQRMRLVDGSLTENIFDRNLALEIQEREDRIQSKDILIETLRDQIYKDKLVEAESDEALQVYLDELVGKGEHFGLILGDIDHFRDVNTQAGHKGGDNAIIKIAERMSRALRIESDNPDDERPLDRIFRMHGDEFAIIVRQLTPDTEGKKQLKTVMERVKHEVEMEPVELEIDGEKVMKNLTVSLGGAVTPKDLPVNPDKFIHLVDTQALYPAKNAGRNTTFVYNLDQQIQQAA